MKTKSIALRHFSSMGLIEKVSEDKSFLQITQYRQKNISIESSPEELKPIASNIYESENGQNENNNCTFSHVQSIKIPM